MKEKKSTALKNNNSLYGFATSFTVGLVQGVFDVIEEFIKGFLPKHHHEEIAKLVGQYEGHAKDIAYDRVTDILKVKKMPAELHNTMNLGSLNGEIYYNSSNTCSLEND
jgi:hypothetical protein